MNKKNLLVSLIIFQGILIVIGLIVVIYTVIAKLQNVDIIDSNQSYSLQDNGQLYLLNENQYQINRIKGNKIIFDIYNLKNSLKVKSITINEN